MSMKNIIFCTVLYCSIDVLCCDCCKKLCGKSGEEGVQEEKNEWLNTDIKDDSLKDYDCYKKLGWDKVKRGEESVILLNNTSEVNNHATNTFIEGNEMQIQNYNVLVSCKDYDLSWKILCDIAVNDVVYNSGGGGFYTRVKHDSRQYTFFYSNQENHDVIKKCATVIYVIDMEYANINANDIIQHYRTVSEQVDAKAQIFFYFHGGNATPVKDALKIAISNKDLQYFDYGHTKSIYDYFRILPAYEKKNGLRRTYHHITELSDFWEKFVPHATVAGM